MADMTCELHGCKHVILFMHAVVITVIDSTNRSGLTRGDLAGITMEHYIIFRINTSICTTSYDVSVRLKCTLAGVECFE